MPPPELQIGNKKYLIYQIGLRGGRMTKRVKGKGEGRRELVRVAILQMVLKAGIFREIQEEIWKKHFRHRE